MSVITDDISLSVETDRVTLEHLGSNPDTVEWTNMITRVLIDANRQVSVAAFQSSV